MARKAYRGVLPVFEGLAAETVRRWMGRRVVAERIRRARRKLDAAIHFLGRNGARGSAADGELPGSRPHPAHHYCLWHGRTKEALYPQDSERGRNLVPGIFRTERGLRPCEPSDGGPPGWRRLCCQWTESMDELRLGGRLVRVGGAHGCECPQAQRSYGFAYRYEVAGRGGAPPASNDR